MIWPIFLKEKLKDFEFRDYYSDIPNKFNNNLKLIINEILNYINNSKPNDISLKRTGSFLSFLHYLIEYLDHAEIGDIPVEMVEVLEDILRKYDKKALLYLKGCYAYNYSYIDIMGFLYYMLENSPIFPGKTNISKQKIGVISFPISQKDNLLLNSVIAHEMGHYLDDILKVHKKIKIKIDPTLLDDFLNDLRKQASEIKAKEKEITLDVFVEKEYWKAKWTEFINKILNRWVEEFISDSIAIYLFGPSYYFAFVNLSSSIQDEFDYSDDHPPFFLRTIPICKTLKELNYITYLSQYEIIKKKLKKYESMKKNTLPTEDKLGKILEKSARGAIPQVLKNVKSLVKPYLSKTKFIKETNFLRDKIKNFIPPNEITDKTSSYPAHPISIINIGWVARSIDIKELYNLLGAKTEEEKFNIRFTLNKLLLKALESGEIHRKILEEI